MALLLLREPLLIRLCLPPDFSCCLLSLFSEFFHHFLSMSTQRRTDPYKKVLEILSSVGFGCESTIPNV